MDLIQVLKELKPLLPFMTYLIPTLIMIWWFSKDFKEKDRK